MDLKPALHAGNLPQTANDGKLNVTNSHLDAS